MLQGQRGCPFRTDLHIVQCFSHSDKGLCAPESAETVLGQGWDEILKGDVFQEQIKMNSSVIHNI